MPGVKPEDFDKGSKSKPVLAPIPDFLKELHMKKRTPHFDMVKRETNLGGAIVTAALLGSIALNLVVGSMLWATMERADKLSVRLAEEHIRSEAYKNGYVNHP